MSPDDPRHGTNAGYYNGCRDECCRLAHNAYRRSVWRKRYARRTDRLYIDATGTVRRIRALQALGWTFVEIDRAMGHGTSSPNATRSHNYIHQGKIHIDNATAVAKVYERLSMTLGPSASLRARAVKKGWAPPLAWDDSTIDDPTAHPTGMSGGGRNTEINATREHELIHLAHIGENLETACAALDITPDALWQWAKRHGHLDLYDRLSERSRTRENQWTAGVA